MMRLADVHEDQNNIGGLMFHKAPSTWLIAILQSPPSFSCLQQRAWLYDFAFFTFSLPLENDKCINIHHSAEHIAEVLPSAILHSQLFLYILFLCLEYFSSPNLTNFLIHLSL